MYQNFCPNNHDEDGLDNQGAVGSEAQVCVGEPGGGEGGEGCEGREGGAGCGCGTGGVGGGELEGGSPAASLQAAARAVRMVVALLTI